MIFDLEGCIVKESGQKPAAAPAAPAAPAASAASASAVAQPIA